MKSWHWMIAVTMVCNLIANQVLTGELDLHMEQNEPRLVANYLATSERTLDTWRQSGKADFGGWVFDGAKLAGDGLVLDASAHADHDPYQPGSYQGGNYFNGGSYYRGEALSPWHAPTYGLDSAVASWNALTPSGTWVELYIRVLVAGGQTKDYIMGIWASDSGTLKRHSVNNQSDDFGRVDTDTINLKNTASAYQIRVRLFSTGINLSPTLKLAAVSVVKNGTGLASMQRVAAWGKDIAVPERSQMIYPAGGENWCSPTSTSMVLAYWSQKLNRPDLNLTVPNAAAHTADWIYDGNGNWAFNAAWVGSLGLESYVTRLNSLAQIETWTGTGFPVIVSVGYGNGELPGTPIPASNGHLLVIRGFDQNGNVITNDPAADPRLGQQTRIVYPRAAFEKVWLKYSGGAAYLIYPVGAQIPSDPIGGGWDTTYLGGRNFADDAMANIWQANDGPVASGVQRSWLWGPQPNTKAMLESYAEAPGHVRTVQYFDKGRMELTNSQASRASKWFITSGLLTVELVSGRLQVGDSAFVNRSPAAVPVAGDLDSAITPTYASFQKVASLPGAALPKTANLVGQPVTNTLDRAGQSGQNANLGHYTNYAAYDEALGHNMAGVFWNWMNATGSGFGGNWLFVLGHPISEPFWVATQINGQNQTVLVQLFERRVLTYNPNNAAAWQVEMGNIGLHYYRWRHE